jgi:preprotein translocase subunit SecG
MEMAPMHIHLPFFHPHAPLRIMVRVIALLVTLALLLTLVIGYILARRVQARRQQAAGNGLFGDADERE